MEERTKQKIESRLKKTCICVEEREREVKFWISRVKKMEEKRQRYLGLKIKGKMTTYLCESDEQEFK
jgi:hypothetical protein